ncbi:hypothetical protein F5Y08DRAFT_198807 [Xylaria arbuscula]|nr:hypothetical protein F5Y08DRAFT_198807 [Xylaria arbuscula]
MSSFLPPSSPTTSFNTDTTDSYPDSPLPPSSPQDLANTSPRLSSDFNEPIPTMASPVKTAPPTSLDRSFGDQSNSLSAPSLPMPGLSGRGNSSTGNAKQATCSRDPSTTTESSRAPPSSLASNLTLRPKSTSPPASEVTSSWGFTRCGFHKQPAADGPLPSTNTTSHNDTSSKDGKHHTNNGNGNDALIPGLFFLGGENSDDGSEFQFGNVRVHLQTSTQGFVVGAGRESVSILRITLRFTLDFMDEKDFGLDYLGFESIKKKKGFHQTDHHHGGIKHGDVGAKGEQEHSLSLSLTMTITIMAINSSSLS